MPDQEDVNDVKEFMNIMTEVKVSVAEMNGKMDRVMDYSSEVKSNVEKMQSTVDEVKVTANAADARSITNEKNIEKIESNNRRTNVALITMVGAFVLQLIFYMLTFNF